MSAFVPGDRVVLVAPLPMSIFDPLSGTMRPGRTLPRGLEGAVAGHVVDDPPPADPLVMVRFPDAVALVPVSKLRLAADPLAVAERLFGHPAV